MKSLILKLVVPLTIITFSMFTKWWYVLPVDAPDTMMSGFPLIWISQGWHTSMSLQIFLKELLINLFIYFSVILIITYLIHKYVVQIQIPKLVTLVLTILTGIICTGAILIGTMPEHVYKSKRDFEIEVLTTGYKFIWQTQERPKYEDYKK
ncbi:hypothetical protein [Tenacibaculum agarivorans]|uniref:hypothetical protein n=1 Tax=Tenacibaculum agarivorans TaxID=1908389 RepID=UPI00094BADF8|nr:hypothetical protein [Tenacibaculum agarivorans]